MHPDILKKTRYFPLVLALIINSFLISCFIKDYIFIHETLCYLIESNLFLFFSTTLGTQIKYCDLFKYNLTNKSFNLQ